MDSTKKRPVISFKEIEAKSLKEISAADFLTALDSNQFQQLVFWPEKKKYELEIEPVIEQVNVKEIFRILKGEKKKVEREVPDFFSELVNNPKVYDRLVEDVAQRIRLHR